MMGKGATRIALDCLSLGFSLGPGSGAIVACVGWLCLWDSRLALALAAAALPLVAAVAFLLITLALRLCLPRLETGLHPQGWNRNFLAWYAHIALARASVIFPIRPLLQSGYITRFLYWRALGAKVPFDLHSSHTVDLSDAPLIRIGPGTLLADRVKISAHMLMGEKLYLAPVQIGAGCLLSVDSSVGPKSILEDGARLDPGEHILRKRVPAKKA